MSNTISPAHGAPEAPTATSDLESTRKKAHDAPAPQSPADPESVTAAIRSMGGQVQFGGRVAEFSYNDDLNTVVVKVYSSATEPREVVRQIPPEEYLAFAARYRELLGVLFDEQA